MTKKNYIKIDYGNNHLNKIEEEPELHKYLPKKSSLTLKKHIFIQIIHRKISFILYCYQNGTSLKLKK